MIASGGDDTTVRLWTLDARTRKATLLGTLVAVPAAPDEVIGGNRFAAFPTRAEWIAFTPEGIYDSSLDGDRMISFIIGSVVQPLEQFSERFHKYRLTEDLRLGARPQPPTITPPPSLVIDPLPGPDLKNRDTELRISLGDRKLKPEDVRLYQNGVPVQIGSDFRALDERGHYAARVHLRSGLNRFYVMASREGDIDARSEDMEVRFDGQNDPGRLHVVALGVNSYARNSLRFASLDAQQLADHLHRNGIEGVDRPGRKIVLTDGDVTARSVDDAFATVRREVKGRPEDVVVVFMAGHTDVLKDTAGRERFSLLLKPFPFPQNAPMLAMNRGVGVGGNGEALPPGVDLPFTAVYHNLSRLDALQRLVIIDACQAEAIFNDPDVQRIQRVLDRDTHRARTSYLLAARRGEPANEAAVLEHGLLTYVLLRGMDAPGLRPLPVPLAPFDEMPNADRNRDGTVTSRELREYADRTLPILASRLPELAQRGGVAAAPPRPQALRLQTADSVGFRLITLPKEPVAKAGGEE
jgi:hypothetical protein